MVVKLIKTKSIDVTKRFVGKPEEQGKTRGVGRWERVENWMVSMYYSHRENVKGHI